MSVNKRDTGIFSKQNNNSGVKSAKSVSNSAAQHNDDHNPPDKKPAK